METHSHDYPIDQCGVAAVYLKKDPSNYPKGGASYFLQKMLLQLQHRGQLSAGITVYDPDKTERLSTYKGNGLVSEVFRHSNREKALKLLEDYSGVAGIGHVRYATAGGDSVEEAQPFERKHARLWKWFSFGFNGNIANSSDIRAELEKSDYFFHTNTDTEALMHGIAHQMGEDKPTPHEDAFSKLTQRLDGAYSLTFIDARGNVCALRDPMGFKPLSFVNNEDYFLVASESVALQSFAKGTEIIELPAGNMLHVNGGNLSQSCIAPAHEKKAACIFESVYFSSPASVMNEQTVYESRWRLGVSLALAENEHFGGDAYVVVNVPNTSKPAADGYAYTLKLPAMEGLLQNRYVGRTFIANGKWEDRVREKFTVNPMVMRGKKVILVEDSIVRGSTIRLLAQRLREEGGAVEVHARIACPPVINPCFYGIDMSTYSELAAVPFVKKEKTDDEIFLTREMEKELGKKLELDSLRYLSMEGLLSSIRLTKENACTACLNGKYPTPSGKQRAREAWEKYMKKEGNPRLPS